MSDSCIDNVDLRSLRWWEITEISAAGLVAFFAFIYLLAKFPSFCIFPLREKVLLIKEQAIFVTENVIYWCVPDHLATISHRIFRVFPDAAVFGYAALGFWLLYMLFLVFSLVAAASLFSFGRLTLCVDPWRFYIFLLFLVFLAAVTAQWFSFLVSFIGAVACFLCWGLILLLVVPAFSLVNFLELSSFPNERTRLLPV